MEDNLNRGLNFSLYLLLFISFLLLFIDSVECYQIALKWYYSGLISNVLFDSCIKWELYTKTVFSTFTILGAVSILILSICLLIGVNWFGERIFPTFLHFNYIIFGPYMLSFSLMGICFWNEVMYVCDRQNLKNKIFSFSNFLSVIGCFFIAGVIVLSMTVHQVTMLFVDSTLRKPEGSEILRKTIWWIVLKNRDPVEFIRTAQEQANILDNERRNRGMGHHQPGNDDNAQNIAGDNAGIENV